METILETKHIYKSFVGVQALKDINIKINKGEIHCFAGENGCGKSTLIKNISGVYTPDSGEMILNGKKYQKITTKQAMDEGVQVIYQDLSLFPHLTVAENIAIGKIQNSKKTIINWKEIYQIAEEQLRKIGVSIDLHLKVSELSIANKQIVAICRALAQNAKLLFMDEPTTALTKKEVDRLLEIMVDLKKRGMAIVFISHKLDEVFSVADMITIFRNGEKIGDYKSDELDKKSLSYYMTGREVDYPKYIRTVKDDNVILEVDNLTRQGQYEQISFQVRKGDIIGLIGRLGAGRTELALSLFGLNPVSSGTIKIEGKEVVINSPQKAKECNIALLPEDRFTQGLFMDREIKQNISSGVLPEISNKGIDLKKEVEIANQYIEQLKVRTPSCETVVGTLSGGNQQKVVIGKWLATSPKIFIMDNPTVGIDIGAKAEIYEQIHHFANKGMSVIFISDEIPEILANCNKILVLSEGKQIAYFDENDLETEDMLLEEKIKNLLNDEKKEEQDEK